MDKIEHLDSKISNKNYIFTATIVFITVISLWILSLLLVLYVGNPGITGTFGDSFGAINALFSGMAFASVLLALLLQRDDLRTSLRELELSTKALERQAVASTQMIEETRTDREERRNLIWERFSTDRMKSARTNFWVRATEDWFNDDKYQENLIYYNDRDSNKYNRFIDDLYYCGDIINFFSYIYRTFENDEEGMRDASKEFFYHWWRGYLLSYVLCCRKSYDEKCPNNISKEQLPFHPPLEHILLLDKICCVSPFDPELHFYYKDRKIIVNERRFPGIEEHNKGEWGKSF